MSLLTWLVFAGFASGEDSSKAPLFHVESHTGGRRVGLWWDADFQLGLGHQWRQNSQLVGGVGARLGITRVTEPWFFTIGLTGQWVAPETFSMGVQLEAMNLWSGVWIQPGLALQTDGQLMVSGTAGFSVVGVEFRATDFASPQPHLAVLARLRVPVGIIALAIKERRRKQ
jgi:hypothetical protein